MKTISFVLITLSIVLSSLSAQAASIKKWVDENGRVFYGDTPPPSANVQTVKTQKRPTKLGKPLPRLSTTSNAAESKNKTATKNKLEPAQAKEICDVAKKDVKALKKSSRIQLRSADGSLRYMTKEEIKKRLERSNSEIKQFCK